MISKEHEKHSSLTKPAYGRFARNEWAFVGGQCDSIRKLAGIIIQALSSFSCAYVDARHSNENDELSLPGTLSKGAGMEYMYYDQYHQLNYRQPLDQFQLRELFRETDLALVNGNHFEAGSQIIIIDPAKKQSLEKRITQLVNAELILLADDKTEVFDFIKKAIPGWQQLPAYRLEETEKIIDFFRTKMIEALPAINGLVLAGGFSQRMGTDKGTFRWHAKEQRYFMADMLQELCAEVFISCRKEQEGGIDNHYRTLADTFTGLGPYGAILSAFRQHPDAAWLVVACDLPLLDKLTLQHLLQNRNSSSIATAFEGHNKLPEPLIAIWEPKSYPVLLSFLSQGYSCPGKVLRNSKTTILKAPSPASLTNVNTPEEMTKIKDLIAVS